MDAKNVNGQDDQPAQPWVIEWKSQIRSALENARSNEEIAEKLTKVSTSELGRKAHPADDHWVPFGVALGAAMDKGVVKPQYLYEGVEFAVGGMGVYAFSS